MRMRSLVAIGLVAVLGGGVTALADLTNPGFESGLSGWMTSGPVFATDWEYSRDFLDPVDPDWLPTEGQFFASLWSTSNDGVSFSSMSQEFTANAGEVLSFDYFFDFGDFAEFPDEAWATLTSMSSGASVVLFEHNTPGHALGDDENVGWTTVTETLAGGNYMLEFFTRDFDGAMESILGVDNVAIGTTPIPAPGAVVLAIIGLACLRSFRRNAVA